MAKNIPIVCLVLVLLAGCSSKSDETPAPRTAVCSQSSLAIALQNNTPSSSCTANDGSIMVAATGGAAPYSFRLNGGTAQASATFGNLSGGSYAVSVTDANGCIRTLNTTIATTGSTLAAGTTGLVPNTICGGGNGAITLTGSGGTPGYEFRLGTGSFSTTATFNNLATGTYNGQVRDATSCVVTLTVVITQGITTTFAANVQPIINSKCAISGCHNGSQSPNLSNHSGVAGNAEAILSRITTGSMPPSNSPNGGLTAAQVQAIGCWVNEGSLNN